MSNDFWARKLEKKAREEGWAQQLAPIQRSNGPWWRDDSGLVPGQGYQDPQAQNPSEGRDFSKAVHLKSESSCPECGHLPGRGKNFYKPSPSMARRCFECGYVEMREIHDVSTYMSPTLEGPAQMSRQTASGGRVINNYHQITTAGDAVARIN